MRKNLLALVLVGFGLNSFAVDKAQISADKEALKSACASDAAAAGCPGAEYGKGLLRCLGKFKKANKDVKISEACKAATLKLKSDKAERRAQRKSERSSK